MRRLRNMVLAFLIGCSTPILIWVGAGSALYQRRKEKTLPGACSIDADCPLGYVCVSGRCMPAEA